jgi:DNA-binding MarR family transcriptional regulator
MIEDRAEREAVSGGVHPIVPPLALAFKRTISLMERESGVSGMKLFILSVLRGSDGISQGEFVREYEMAEPSRVTRTAQALEADGLIRRERDPEDNRVVRMYLTDGGREALRRLPVVNERLHERARSVLDEDEVEELARMLRLVAGAMKE